MRHESSFRLQAGCFAMALALAACSGSGSSGPSGQGNGGNGEFSIPAVCHPELLAQVTEARIGAKSFSVSFDSGGKLLTMKGQSCEFRSAEHTAITGGTTCTEIYTCGTGCETHVEYDPRKDNAETDPWGWYMFVGWSSAESACPAGTAGGYWDLPYPETPAVCPGDPECPAECCSPHGTFCCAFPFCAGDCALSPCCS
jgi:hypothetical protein